MPEVYRMAVVMAAPARATAPLDPLQPYGDYTALRSGLRVRVHALAGVPSTWSDFCSGIKLTTRSRL